MSSGTILIVDDSHNILIVLQALLKAHGFEVRTADSGKQALEMLGERSYDAVISDIQMPAMNGLELLERIKKTVDATLPVILITAHITAENAMEAIRLGADDFLSKPLDTAKVIRSISAQISKKQTVNPISKSFDFVKKLHLVYHLSARDFFQESLASMIVSQLQLLKEIPAAVFNSMIIAIDEMLSNAFLHGTFCLDKNTRNLKHEDFLERIKKLLENEEIACKKVEVEVVLDRDERKITFSVLDEGPGFNYQNWLNQEVALWDFAGTGRGIYLLKVLSDHIEYSHEGRKIIIEKHYHRS